MNLERLLAENMIRFGTKNVNGAILRTLLNEAYKAGDVVNVEIPTVTPTDGANPAIAQYLGKYASTKLSYGRTTGTLVWNALVSLTYATLEWAKTDKAFAKLQNKMSRPMNFDDAYQFIMGSSAMGEYDGVGTNGNAIMQAVIAKAGELTTQVTYTNTAVDIYPGVTYPTMIASVGRAMNLQVINPGKQVASGYDALLKYMNTFNQANVLEADFTQYVLSDMVTAENFVDLQITVSANNRFYVYTPGTKQPDVADKELTSTTVGAAAPVSKQYDVSFDTGVATIPAGDAEVAKAVQDAIAMFPDGNISNLTVVSSASPEYNSAQGGPRTLADYGQNTTGTGDPGAGTDNIAKNKKLAYDRGVSFMTALNAGLEAQGKPAVTGYTVNWQISDKGGSKVPGRYAEVQWETAGSKGTEVPGAKSTGTAGATTDGKATFNMTQHQFSW